MASSSNPRGSTHEFETFFEGWLVHQEHYLEELQSALKNVEELTVDYLNDLAARVSSHYQEYYKQKSRLVRSDVFIVFDPPWFTPFEKSLFWVAGYKPDLAFKVVEETVNDLTMEQSQKMEQLKKTTKFVQRELSDQLASIQELVGGPVISACAMAVQLPVDQSKMDSGLQTLRSELVNLVLTADGVRNQTASYVAEMLNPNQTIKFLAAVTQMQRRARTVGLEIKARTRRGEI